MKVNNDREKNGTTADRSRALSPENTKRRRRETETKTSGNKHLVSFPSLHSFRPYSISISIGIGIGIGIGGITG
ncbi:hypothetical protein GW17_00055569 [Ensete ventricosum]|nr:hypothetical protein GW17_00055569 [Ensete ventricosum]